MATPASGVGLTATQQQIVDAAVQASANQVGGTQQTGSQQQAAFAAYLSNPANNITGATVAPSGLDFSTGASQNPGLLGGNDASTQQIEKAVDPFFTNSQTYAQGAPGLIAAINNLFTSVAGGYTAPAPVAATPQPQTAPPVTGTSSNPSTNPNPAVTGDVNTTTATTATTGQNLATADPNSVLGQLLNALTNGGSTPLGASTDVSLPPSTILPTDSSGGSTTSGSGTSTASNTPTSMTDMIVIGVIASLVAAAIWYFAIHHGSLKALEKDVHV
jgi:hypothetical protein